MNKKKIVDSLMYVCIDLESNKNVKKIHQTKSIHCNYNLQQNVNL